MDDDFYEEDEPIERIRALISEDGVTWYWTSSSNPTYVSDELEVP